MSAINREFKQIATASFNTATGSKIIQLRVIAHVSRSHPAVAGNPSTPAGRFWRSLVRGLMLLLSPLYTDC